MSRKDRKDFLWMKVLVTVDIFLFDNDTETPQEFPYLLSLDLLEYFLAPLACDFFVCDLVTTWDIGGRCPSGVIGVKTGGLIGLPDIFLADLLGSLINNRDPLEISLKFIYKTQNYFFHVKNIKTSTQTVKQQPAHCC